ncbi:MAG: GAF domain-containing protein [Anaerolineae bacterium]|jgi:PAS domain S-box-containing protein|nr:GAF domain-containing protein [Anaerolineae bacterium]
MGKTLPTRDQNAALRKKLESLQSSEKRYRELIERIPIGVFESTMDGKILRANQYLVNLLNYPSEDRLLEANINHLYYNHEEVFPQIILTLQRTERMENVDLRLFRYDGSTIWVSVNLRLMHDEQNNFLIQGMVSDVSNRKQSERALRESEERYQSVVMALVEGVMVSDKDDHVTACNPRAMKILDCANNQIVGKHPFHGLRVFSENGRELSYEEQPSFLALSTDRPSVNQTLKVIRDDGEEIWLQVNAQPLSFPGETSLNGVVISFQEITERMISQQQIKHQMTVLETVNAIETAGSEALNEEQFLYTVEGWIRNVFNRLDIDFFILDPSNNELYNLTREYFIPVGEGLIGRTAAQGEGQLHQHDDTTSEDCEPLHPGTLIHLCLPIVAEGTVLGVLNVESNLHEAIPEETQSMMSVLVLQVATAILRIRSLEDERKRLKQLETLVNISRAMRRAQATNEILSILVDRTVEILGASMVSMLLEFGDHLKVVWNYGIDHRLHAEKIPINPDDPYWQVIYNRQMMTLADHGDTTNEYPQNTILNEIRTHSLWSVIMPIKAANRVLGLMHIAFNDQRRRLTRSDREVLTTISEIAGISLHRAQITETLEQRVVERTRSLEMMYNVRRVSAQLVETHEMLEMALAEVLDGMNSPSGAIYLMNQSGGYPEMNLSVSQGLSTEILEALSRLEFESQIYWQDWMRRDPRVIEVKDLFNRPQLPDVVRNANLHHFLALPMKAAGNVGGVMVIIAHEPNAFNAEEINLLQTIGDQIMDAVTVSRLRQQAEEGAVVQERQRLARELHDSVTQALYSLNLMVNAARRFAESGNMERARYFLDQLPDISQQALKEMRLLIYDLRPSALESEGLYTALSQRIEVVEKRAGVDAKLDCDSNLKVHPQVESALYRITIEALNNILKHAAATRADIRIKEEQGSIVLEIEDNGKGIDLSEGSYTQGIGMRSMRERTELLGGTFDVLSKVGQDSGTIIQAVIPMDANLK